MKNIDTFVVGWTERLHDTYYAEKPGTAVCPQCGNIYLEDWEESCVSKLDDEVIFCCEGCRDNWDDDNAWEYEE